MKGSVGLIAVVVAGVGRRPAADEFARRSPPARGCVAHCDAWCAKNAKYKSPAACSAWCQANSLRSDCPYRELRADEHRARR